jgi:opacity protein-like surface antigen
MIRTAALASAALLFAAAPAMAQASKVEISGNVGWIYSDGVTGTAIHAADGNTYNELDPKDSFGYHFTVGLHASPAVELGFLYGRQQSKLQAKGTQTLEIGDLNVDNYHVYFAYNFGGQSAVVKPFIYGGVGSTKYSDVNFNIPGSINEHTIQGQTRFSTTWGAGVKIYPTKVVGFRAEARWVPTYIKSDAVGWWCDPFWGCYVVGNAQYSNQFGLSGGLTLRF